MAQSVGPMWKRSRLLLLTIFLMGAAAPQPGYFVRTDCDSITGAVDSQTACLQSTTTGGRTSGHLYIRQSSAWVDITGNGTILGSIANTQVAIGSAANTISGSSKAIWASSGNYSILTLDDTAGAETKYSVGGVLQWTVGADAQFAGTNKDLNIYNEPLAKSALRIIGDNNNFYFWSDESASHTVTFGLSGATDPVFTFSDALTTISTGNLAITALTASRCLRTDGSKVLSSDSADCLNSSTAVTSIAKSGSTALVGAVTVTGTTPVVATQAAQNLDFSCATCGVTGSPLSQFAATTSAQFFGVISDETGGAGVVVGNSSPALTTPAITGTPSVAGALGYVSGNGTTTQYSGLTATVGSFPRVLSVSRPNETKSNGTTNDQDYTSIYQIPANVLIAQKVIRVTLLFSVTTDGAASSQLYYLKLGATKVCAQTAAATPVNNITTRGFLHEFLIFGTAAAGASTSVDCAFVNPAVNNSALWSSSATTAAIATNGTLNIVPGIAFGTNTSGESSILLDAMVQELN